MPLGHMIGKFVPQGKPDPVGQLIGPDQINTDQLRFFATVQRESRDRYRGVWSDQNAAIPFVEPFRLCTDFAGARFPSIQTEFKHFHRIRQRARRRAQIRMH